MADVENNRESDIQLLKRTRISVFVDEALPDILVVSYEFGLKIFKGVLLDSTKRNLPCGVNALNPAFNVKPKPDDDVLYSVNQRFAYTDPRNTKKRNVQIPSKYKNSKMTVRLRPRQVLCTKCKGICNENSENVSKKRKAAESIQPAPPVKRGANAPITRSVYSELNNKKKLESKLVLVPKIPRLKPQEISNALSGNVNKLNIIENTKKPLSPTTDDNIKCPNSAPSVTDSENTPTHEFSEQTSHSTVHSDSIASSESQHKERSGSGKGGKSVKRILRKKRSIGLMEDLWDESVFEENGHNKNNNVNTQSNANTEQQSVTGSVTTGSICINTRTIKISYGPQGEGTVLKIPAVIEGVSGEENAKDGEAKIKNPDTDSKAARRALRRARREARRKELLAGTSPCYLGSSSPRYALGLSSPRYSMNSASPRHPFGGNSPRYVMDPKAPRRRKHKMKHKKKHREDKDKKHREGEVSSTQQEDAAKEQCLSQKLSINLKRLNNTYTSRQPVEESHSSSDEQVPDFPPSDPPLMLRINSQPVLSASSADGGRLTIGDVVWGKIHGFPWWPGKVLNITNIENQGPRAHVSWYGSSTSSLMQCDQLSPYLENFKVRHNKKKRGPYKEAVKQATTEAREKEGRLRESVVNSSQGHSIISVVPNALASPREIDVAS